MIRGRVSESRQARVIIDLIDGVGVHQPVEAVVDTGFTGYLTLPAETIGRIGLPSVGRRTFELANGDLFEFEAYLAEVSWHGRLRGVLTLKSGGVPLLGTALLWGSRITMNALAGGEVTIEELQAIR